MTILLSPERRIESDKVEGDQQCAKDLYDTTVEEVKALTESICTETGKSSVNSALVLWIPYSCVKTHREISKCN